MHSGYAYDLFSIYCIFYILDRCWNEWPRYILYYVIKQIFFISNIPSVPIPTFDLIAIAQRVFYLNCVYFHQMKWRGRERKKKRATSNFRGDMCRVKTKNHLTCCLFVFIGTHTHKMCTSQMPSIPLAFNIKAFLLKYSLFLFLLLKMDCNLFIFFSFALLSNVNPMFESTLEFLQNSKRFRI